MKQWVSVLYIQSLLQKQFKHSLIRLHGRVKHYLTVKDGLILEATHFPHNCVTRFAHQKVNVSESDIRVKYGRSKNRKFRTYILKCSTANQNQYTFKLFFQSSFESQVIIQSNRSTLHVSNICF